MCITHIFTSTLGIGLGIPCLMFGVIMLISFLMCEFLEKYFTNVCLFWRPFRRRARGIFSGSPTTNSGEGPAHHNKSSSSAPPHIECETRQRISSNAGRFSSLVDVKETYSVSTVPPGNSSLIDEPQQYTNQSDPPPPYEKCFPKPPRRDI